MTTTATSSSPLYKRLVDVAAVACIIPGITRKWYIGRKIRDCDNQWNEWDNEGTNEPVPQLGQLLEGGLVVARQPLGQQAGLLLDPPRRTAVANFEDRTWSLTRRGRTTDQSERSRFGRTRRGVWRSPTRTRRTHPGPGMEAWRGRAHRRTPTDGLAKGPSAPPPTGQQ